MQCRSPIRHFPIQEVVHELKISKLHKPKHYSLKKRVQLYILFVCLSFLFFAGFLTKYFSEQLVQNSYENVQQTLKVYIDEVEQNLSAAQRCLLDMTANNNEVLTMLTMSEEPVSAINRTRVHQLLRTYQRNLVKIDGLFLYGTYTGQYVWYESTSSRKCIAYLKELLPTLNESNETSYLYKWFFIDLDGEYYLMHIIKNHLCYAAAWMPMESLISSFPDSNTSIVYTDTDGIPLIESSLNDYILSPSDSLDEPHSFYDAENIQYLQISAELPFTASYLVACTPMKEILSSLTTVMHFVEIIFVALVVLMVVWMIYFTRFFSAPIQLLKNFSLKLPKEDNVSHLDLSHEDCEEVLEIGGAMNTLLNEITNLKIDVYEQKLAKKEQELLYLKSQVAPHFLINCLSTIGSMPGTNEGQAMTKQLIRTLSNHLRYTMSSRTMVPLSEELAHVENYLKLTSIRFPGFLTWTINVDEECKDASVFPILVLMITENTIKYNMVMGEMLKVKVTGVMTSTENGQKHIVLTHLDSGSGFSEESLIDNNRPLEEQQHDVNGHKLGCYNIKKRIFLIYGETARIHFSNEPGWGAKTTIDIPYIPYKEASDIQKNTEEKEFIV